PGLVPEALSSGQRRACRAHERAGVRLWGAGYIRGRLAGGSRLPPRRERPPARCLDRAGRCHPLSLPGPGCPRRANRVVRRLADAGVHAALRLLRHRLCDHSRHYRAVLARPGDVDLLLRHVPFRSGSRSGGDRLAERLLRPPGRRLRHRDPSAQGGRPARAAGSPSAVSKMRRARESAPPLPRAYTSTPAACLRTTAAIRPLPRTASPWKVAPVSPVATWTQPLLAASLSEAIRLAAG